MIKKLLFPVLATTLAMPAFSQQKPAPAVKKAATKPAAGLLKTKADSVSYAFGLNIGNGMKTEGISQLNAALVARAIQDALKNNPSLLTKEQSDMSISNYLQQLKAEKMQKNKEAGEQFLSANKTKTGVVTLPSGLQYQILKEGNGPKPTLQDKVKTHYHGTLIDGTVFDSSVDRGEPISFPVSGVISGWTEALQLMPVGSKWRLFIPANLAYGDRQAGPKIGPGSALVFEVELLEIVK